MKYIIKNCPQCIEYTDGANRFFICQTTNTYCQITENCLLKRIAEDCKKEKEPICTIDNDDGTSTTYFKNDTYLANKILETLEIEEVDE